MRPGRCCPIIHAILKYIAELATIAVNWQKLAIVDKKEGDYQKAERRPRKECLRGVVFAGRRKTWSSERR